MYDNFSKFEDSMDLDVDGMQQFHEYQEMGVDTIIDDISVLSEKLIESTCNFYLSNSEIFNENDIRYIEAIKGSERNNLQVLLKQVKYVEHILDNLMRQLDGGGYMDVNIYTTIQEMQKSSMEITMQVSKYTRNLPDYFKYVKMDLEQAKEQEAIEKNNTKAIESGGSSDVTIDSESDGVEDDNRFNRPYRGVRELLMDLEKEEDSLDIAIRESKDLIPEPIIIEDEDAMLDVEDIEYEEE